MVLYAALPTAVRQPAPVLPECSCNTLVRQFAHEILDEILARLYASAAVGQALGQNDGLGSVRGM